MRAPTGISAVRSGFWFLAVGVAAALTHLLVFAAAQHRMWPELANAAGFGVAFFVSFFGHRRLSFRDSGTTARQSFQRFAVTALVAAAAQTFLLGRYWAFRR